MSQDELHDLANSDTPSQVPVPNTWAGIAIWAVGRFGIGIVFTGLLAYGIAVVYQDGRTDQAQLLSAYNKSTEVMSRVTLAMEAVTKQVDVNTRRIDNIQQTQSYPR